MKATEREQYWIRNLQNVKDDLEEMKNSDEPDKNSIWFQQTYVRYLEEILKYNNLQIPDSENAVELLPGVFRGKRVAKINRSIPWYELDNNHVEWFSFNGMYAVTDVLFIDSSMYDLGYNPDTKGTPTVKIPSEILSVVTDNCRIGTIKNVYFEEDGCVHKYYAFMCRRELLDIYCQFNANWDYPYIREKCDGDNR